MDRIPPDDHGAFSGDQEKATNYLYNNNIIAFIVIVIAIITSEFWFETFHQIVREITGQSEPRWYYMLASALFWTIIFILVSIIIFKVPIASSFTL